MVEPYRSGFCECSMGDETYERGVGCEGGRTNVLCSSVCESSSNLYAEATIRESEARDRGDGCLAIALAYSTSDVLPHVWTQIRAWCDANVIDELALVVKIGADDRLDLGSCRVSLVQQDAGLDALSRLERMRELRARQLDALKARTDLPGVVVVVDLDVERLPSPWELLVGIDLVRTGDWDVLCANGAEHYDGQLSYYDTFATIRHGSGWMYPPELSEQRNLFRELSASPERVVDVRACFGGLGVYRRDLWTGGPDGNCSYRYQPQASFTVATDSSMDSDHPFWCEHVGLTECLRLQQPSLRMGVMGLLQLRRGYDPHRRRRLSILT
tara:strand:+ start:293 stop:1276 length:984 start_codon:yes stop_codon:yes gene_type:complete